MPFLADAYPHDADFGMLKLAIVVLAGILIIDFVWWYLMKR